MREGIGGHVMVHRTDIAGNVVCSTASPTMTAYTAMHRMAPSSKKSHLPQTSAYSYFGGKKCSRLLMTAVPSVHAIYVETLGR
jgi:hypothetical protein